jgi:hypothetical protein
MEEKIHSRKDKIFKKGGCMERTPNDQNLKREPETKNKKLFQARKSADQKGKEESSQRIDEMSEQSFPASDPPTYSSLNPEKQGGRSVNQDKNTDANY